MFTFRNPTPSPVDTPLGGNVTWGQFTFDEMNVMYLGDENIGTVEGYRQREYSYWNQHIVQIAGTELGKVMVYQYL